MKQPVVDPGSLLVLRCHVTSARLMHASMGQRCLSAFECVACGMPNKQGRGECELCGGTAFVPLGEPKVFPD